MLGLISALLFVGYTLVYAAIAEGGKFAATPWESLRTDAYTGLGAGGTASSADASTNSHASTFDRIMSVGGKLFRVLPVGLP